MEMLNMAGQSSSKPKPAVRIIFRGLILFRIENPDSDDGRIVAQLIDHDFGSGATASMPGMQMAGASGVHRHQAEVQILSGSKGQSVVPARLERGVDIDIVPQGVSGGFVSAAESYRDCVPKLSTIIEKISDPDLRPEKKEPNGSFIRNKIIVHRGTIRATEIVSWDSGGYPLDGSEGSGNVPRSPVDVRFMSSDYFGRVAGECIIDVDGATGVDLITTDDALTGLWDPAPKGKRHNQHVPPDTVEILITNLPPQREKPIPWSVHYQWLFRAAGYEPAPFNPIELQKFEESAVAYANGAFDVIGEDLSLLDGPNHDRGLPFPYLKMPVLSDRSLRRSVALGNVVNDPWNRPLCPHGDE